MLKYIIIHNKHEGCYDFHCYQDEVARIRLTSITINPPIIYMFNTRDEAQDFFEDYINDIDCIDIKCKKGEDVEHVEYCTCGCVELDENENPVLFYNKKNQIFLLEHGPQVFMPKYELRDDIKNLNLTNSIMRKCKSLSREQRKKYIELGKYCEECNIVGKEQGEVSDDEAPVKSIFDDDDEDYKKNTTSKKYEIKNNIKYDENGNENITISVSNPIPISMPISIKEGTKEETKEKPKATKTPKKKETIDKVTAPKTKTKKSKKTQEQED
jgi:hypothetical protein